MNRRKFNKYLFFSPLIFPSWNIINQYDYLNSEKTSKNPFPINEFRVFERQNLFLPPPIDEDNRFLVVPLKFFVKENNEIDNIEFDHSAKKPKRTHFTNVEFKFTERSEFLDEAIKLIKQYPKWADFNQQDEKSDFEQRINIYFSYHLNLFRDNGSTIVLNPSEKAAFQQKDVKYYSAIEGKYGCDGIVNVLCLVEKDGSLSNFEVLGTSGKTNFKMAKYALDNIGNLIPAKHNNEVVSSQLDLLIYT